MKKNVIIAILLAMIVFGGGIILSRVTMPDGNGNLSGWQSRTQSYFDNSEYIVQGTTTLAIASSTTLLLENPGRQFARIWVEENASSTVYLGFSTSSSFSKADGIPLGNIQDTDTPYFYQIDFTNLYTGRVAAFTTTSDLIVHYIESNR